MRKLRVLCSGLMLSLLTCSMVVNTVNVRVRTAAAATVESDEDGEEIYYNEEDGVKLSDLYEVTGEEELLPVFDPNGVAPLATWRTYTYLDYTLAPGKTATLAAWIYYTAKRKIEVAFTPNKTCTLTVGLKVDASDTIIALKEVSCTSGTRKTVTFTINPGTTVNPFILNTSGLSVNLHKPEVSFVCEV